MDNVDVNPSPFVATPAVAGDNPVGIEVGTPDLPNPVAPTDGDGTRGAERVDAGVYSVEDGKIIIDHDGFPTPGDGVTNVPDDPTTPEENEPRR